MTSGSGHPRAKAVAFAAIGVTLLCFMDGVIKHLIATNDTLVVVLGRYAVAAVLAAAIWVQAGKPALTGEVWRAHGARGVVIAFSATSFFWSLNVLPLVEVIVIAFIAPLLIPFVARLLLGERIEPRNLIAGAIGFGGVIVASLGAPVEAASDRRLLGVAAVLFSAVSYAVSITLLRSRAGKDGPVIIGLLAALVPDAIVAAPAIATGEWPPMSDLPAFLLLGAFATGGMYYLAKAYAGAEAQVLAPIEYTALVWAALIGWLLFSEPVRPQVWAGAAIIIAACLWGAREPQQRAAPLPAE